GCPASAASATSETGCAPAPDHAVTADASSCPWRSSRSRTVSLANQPDGFRQGYRKDTEVPATEFDVQGLELAWTGVCWGGDLYPGEAGWNCRSFRGTRWQQVRDEPTRRFIVNKYRVLLTRAREGAVIWVPPGDDTDPTRPPQIYDSIADYLNRCEIE